MERYNEYRDSNVQWIGEIPSHWEQRRVRYTGKSRNGLTYSPYDVSEDGQGILVLRSSNIQDGKLLLDDNVYVKKEISPELMVKKGDILICSRNGSRDLVGKLTMIDRDINASFGAFMMIYRTYMWAPFMEKVLSVAIQSYKTLFSTSTINQLTNDIFKDFVIPIPPLAEQEMIVSYLDSKTSKIDVYVADKEKEIQLLQELKQKTIAEAVTKGLNPNVKMKEYNSLISSQCPEHWKIMRNKSFLSLKGEKVGNRTNEYTLLSLTTKGVIVRDLESGKGKFPKEFDTYQIVKKDDLVFCLFDIDETPRTVGLVDTEGMITGAYTALKVNQSIALPEYVYRYYLCVDDIKALKPYYSGLRKTVRADKFLQLYLPLPPLDEQQAIVAYIEEKCQKIDTLITELQAEIDYLKEYKQRLIADVVTGQVNVQNEK